ncbi:MAG: hypothetical protein ACK52I_16490 [Pseudomonadota bacterium]
MSAQRAKRQQVAPNAHQAVLNALHTVVSSARELNREATAVAEAARLRLGGPKLRAWGSAARKLRELAQPHDALMREPVRVLDRLEPSGVAAAAHILERAIGHAVLEDWNSLVLLGADDSLEAVESAVRAELAALAVRAEAPKPRAAAKRERPQTLDEKACAAVDAFIDHDSPSYLPGWRVTDVARLLRTSHSALVGRQRDGTPRCPKFLRLRAKHERSPVTRRKRRV